MLGKLPDRNQRELFRPMLTDMIDNNHALALISNVIDWQCLENKLFPLHSHVGPKSVFIRLMVGCLLLKNLKNLGDEIFAKAWI